MTIFEGSNLFSFICWYVFTAWLFGHKFRPWSDVCKERITIIWERCYSWKDFEYQNWIRKTMTKPACRKTFREKFKTNLKRIWYWYWCERAQTQIESERLYEKRNTKKQNNSIKTLTTPKKLLQIKFKRIYRYWIVNFNWISKINCGKIKRASVKCSTRSVLYTTITNKQVIKIIRHTTRWMLEKLKLDSALMI